MGNLEKIAKRRRLRGAVLSAVATVGLLGAALVAPNAIVALKKLGLLPRAREREFIVASRDRLIRRGYLVYEGRFLRLTPKGEQELRALSLKEIGQAKPRRWDGKWRMLIFDIPERRKSLRDKVRRTLEAIGFIRLQDSVWLYPYDCEDLMMLLKADFKVGKDLLYLIVEELEYDIAYRRHFGLRMR
jgi:DNA-binding transcriptional regulator PaaX